MSGDVDCASCPARRWETWRSGVAGDRRRRERFIDVHGYAQGLMAPADDRADDSHIYGITGPQGIDRVHEFLFGPDAPIIDCDDKISRHAQSAGASQSWDGK